MNKLKLTLIIACIGLNFGLYAQTKEEALRDANLTSKATLNLDFSTVLKHTLPTVVDLMGGKDAALTLLKSTFDTMKLQGFVFEKADIIAVSDIVNEQGQHRCVIEGFNQMKMDKQRIKSKSFLLGIYNEVGKFWWFIEAKQLKNTALIAQVLPDFKTKLVIPDDDVQVEALNN